MNQFELKEKRKSFDKHKDFLVTSIKTIGANFSVDTDFGDYYHNGQKVFSTEACTALNQRLANAKALFSEMGENIYEYTQWQIQLIHKSHESINK